MKTVNVIGLGYIGLPTAALLAKSGHRVYGTDVNEEAVKTINNGGIHIIEPDLDSCVERAVSDGLLTAHIRPVLADIYMICVPTPFKEDRSHLPSPDLSFVIESIKSSIYRDLDIKHEMQPLVDKFMVQEKDEKGNTNTIFKMELISKFLKALDKKKKK